MSSPQPPPPPPGPRPVPPPPPPPPGAWSPFGPGITPPPRRSLRWLWITLAVVLVVAVGAATTLLVVRPWDDDSGAVADDDRTRPDEGEADESGADSAPDEEPSASDTAAPAPVSEAVTGDIDDNGFGDAVAVFQSRANGPITRITLSSDGSSFGSAQERVGVFEDRTWADFDGDGTLEEVTWAVDGGDTLTLTSSDLPFEELDFPLGLDPEAPYVNLKPGDFDGDGAVDLVAYGATGPTTVAVWMLRNDGSGFEEPVAWLTLRDTKFFSTSLYPADFTGDGRTDLGALLPAGPVDPKDAFYTGELGVAMLASTGDSFDRGSLDRPSADLDTAALLVGDFAGDGTPLVLALASTGTSIATSGYAWDGARFVEVRGWRSELGTARDHFLASAVVADADGDGLDDVVYATFSSAEDAYGGFRVARSTGGSLEPGAPWARTPRCRGSCFLYFQNGS